MPGSDFFLEVMESQALLGDRFSSIERLGTGGSGAFSLMFTALDTTTGDRVALKAFHPFVYHRADAVYRFESFKREEGLLHEFRGEPGIIQLVERLDILDLEFNAQIQGGPNGSHTFPFPLHYYALELADADVESLLYSGTAISPISRLTIFRDMCKAVQRLHNNDCVHRDLKPSNFLVMSNRAVKLGDFGTARSIEPTAPRLLEAYSGPPGDIHYAAPELRAGIYDTLPHIASSADLFSLGAILYEIMTGIPLTSQVYTSTFFDELLSPIQHLHGKERASEFHNNIVRLSDRFPLPTITASSAVLPASIRTLIESLYRRLAALDYRRRPRSFDDTFSTISTCIRVLRTNKRMK